ncbi:hypothetical protein SDC9_150584 [bioreactor metagenome]|uniref:Uncharacterized protein n=1 Tax=bioreactor metagenome TaxID=1076179 RepID=A0A645EPI2_9ZZZZ
MRKAMAMPNMQDTLVAASDLVNMRDFAGAVSCNLNNKKRGGALASLPQKGFGPTGVSDPSSREHEKTAALT